MSETFPRLPLDLYIEVLTRIPVVHDLSSIQTLLACTETSSELRNAAITPVIWQPHYLARYPHSLAGKEAERKRSFKDDWRLLMISRLRLDGIASNALDAIVHYTSNRIARAREVCELSLDVFDALHLQAQYPASSSELLCSGLTERYWAMQLSGLIARRQALSTWSDCFADNENKPAWVMFEQAIAGLSSFFGVTLTQVCLNFAIPKTV